MAILHRKEEKLQVVLGRLPKKYTHEEFIAMFIKLYSKDWGKIKSAYIKQSQDKEPGTIVRMPKPDLYLKQVLEIYLQNKDVKAVPAVADKKELVAVTEEPVKKSKPVAKAKKEAVVADEPATAPVKKAKIAAKQEDVAEKPVKKTAVKAKKEVAAANEPIAEPVKKTTAKAKKETVAEEKPVKKATSRKKAVASEEPAEAKAATPKKTVSKAKK